MKLFLRYIYYGTGRTHAMAGYVSQGREMTCGRLFSPPTMGSGVQLKLLGFTGSTILPAPEITYSPIPGIWPDLVMEIGSWKAQQNHIVAKYQPIKPIKCHIYMTLH